MTSWQIGDARITAVVEQSLDGLASLISKATPEELAKIEWLKPHYVDTNGQMLGLIQCFVIEIGEKLVLVDTCVGDDKNLEFNPAMHCGTFGLLEKFTDAGFDPKAVDLVLCTHLHFDHVGLNTKLEEGQWVPTFPNARYLFARSEYEHWEGVSQSKPADPSTLTRPFDSMREAFLASHRNVFAQSIMPVVDAGLAEIVDPPCEPLPGVRLIPTPGHTVGHVSVEVHSNGAKSLITGDAFHHPCQIARAEWATIADEDRTQSTATRQQMLKDTVGTDTLFLGTHFA